MSIEGIMAKLSDSEKKEFNDAIENEKTIGINKYNKKDGETLKLKSNLKALGYDPEKFSTIEAFIDSRKAIDKKVTTGEQTIASLTERLDLNDAERESEKAERKAEQIEATKVAKVAKDAKLTTELTKGVGDKFFGSDYMIKDLVREEKVDFVDGKVVFKDGEKTVAFDDGVKSLMESNKDSLKSKQIGGSGDRGGDKLDNNSARIEQARGRMKAFSK